MFLPHPQTNKLNSMYALAGSTWLNVNINELLNDDKYSNWLRRQRGWLNTNGQWNARHGDEAVDFFCVTQGSFAYDNITRPWDVKCCLDISCKNELDEYMFEQGSWFKMNNNRQFNLFTQEMAGGEFSSIV